MARLIAGAAAGKPFLDPVKVAGTAKLGEIGRRRVGGGDADVSERDHRRGLLRGVARAGERAARPRDRGSDRGRELLVRLRPRGRRRQDRRSSPRKGERHTVEVEEPGWLYSFEADAAGEAIRAGRQEFAAPGMSWDDTLGNLRVLDKWRADVGLAYGIERPAARPRTLAGAPLARRRRRSRDEPIGGPERAGVAAGARLRGLPRLRQRVDPARCLLRERRQRLRHRVGLRHRPHRARARRVAGRAARARKSW